MWQSEFWKPGNISVQEEAQPLNKMHNEASWELVKDYIQSSDESVL